MDVFWAVVCRVSIDYWNVCVWFHPFPGGEGAAGSRARPFLFPQLTHP